MTQRRTYVVTVREPDGPTTLKDVRTGQTVRLESAVAAGEQIDRWLRDEDDKPSKQEEKP